MKCKKGFKIKDGKCVEKKLFGNTIKPQNNVNLIIIISSIIFICIMAYFFLPIYSVEVNNGELVTNDTTPTLSVSTGWAKALISFSLSTSRMQDAKKYGVYIINANKIISTSKTTCLRYTFRTKTPCTYYICPSKYAGYPSYRMNGNYQCLYIKYPTGKY